MKVLSAEFVTSAIPGPAGAGIPRDGLPQVAMAGRSNVGKSTLINALGRRTIARTSAAPGKTRLANYYRLTVNGGRGRWSFYLVDLPGYGYARGARSPRGAPKPSATGTDAAAELRAIAEGYFAASSGGYGPAGPPMALLVVDARHPGLELDRQAARWLESIDVRFCLVATKVDKLSRSERARNLKALENTFGMPPVAVSASSGEGLDALWKTIVSLVRTGRA